MNNKPTDRQTPEEELRKIIVECAVKDFSKLLSKLTRNSRIMTEKIKIYIIWDTRENKQWEGNKLNKKFWSKPGHAKSALMQNMTDANNYTSDEIIKTKDYSSYSRIEKFDHQTRFECWECDIVPEKQV